ncbi:maleylpyruvate isomerase N-terminal domain-containing protein [Streptomyces sp. GLT-R25]
MDQGRVVEAFRLEAGQLARAMTGVSAAEWRLPTRCAPWTVSDLLAHVRVVIAWLPGMLATPAPTRAEVSAVEYYRPDDRFAPATNAARIALAQDHAAEQLSGAALADGFNTTWQHGAIRPDLHFDLTLKLVQVRRGIFHVQWRRNNARGLPPPIFLRSQRRFARWTQPLSLHRAEVCRDAGISNHHCSRFLTRRRIEDT